MFVTHIPMIPHGAAWILLLMFCLDSFWVSKMITQIPKTCMVTTTHHSCKFFIILLIIIIITLNIIITLSSHTHTHCLGSLAAVLFAGFPARGSCSARRWSSLLPQPHKKITAMQNGSRLYGVKVQVMHIYIYIHVYLYVYICMYIYIIVCMLLVITVDFGIAAIMTIVTNHNNSCNLYQCGISSLKDAWTTEEVCRDPWTPW